LSGGSAATRSPVPLRDRRRDRSRVRGMGARFTSGSRRPPAHGVAETPRSSARASSATRDVMSAASGLRSGRDRRLFGAAGAAEPHRGRRGGQRGRRDGPRTPRRRRDPPLETPPSRDRSLQTVAAPDGRLDGDRATGEPRPDVAASTGGAIPSRRLPRLGKRGERRRSVHDPGRRPRVRRRVDLPGRSTGTRAATDPREPRVSCGPGS
jgi:hypothetical protein